MQTRIRVRSVLVATVGLLVVAGVPAARGAQLENPIITLSADPFSGAYLPENVFDNRAAEFATSGNGAGTPLSNDPNDGTWLNFDFSNTVTFDTFINRSRSSPLPFDVIVESRLIISDDETFEETDRIVRFNPTGANGAGLVRRFAPVSGRYVRWEATSASGSIQNTGSRQMFFMRTAPGLVPLANPAVVGGSPAFNPNYALQNAANGNAGRDGTNNEYASAGAGAATFVDFDFGAAKPIAGFDFFNREQDLILAYDMVFSNSADFSNPLATMSFTGSFNANEVNDELFDPVTARYVRLRATEFALSPNTGISEIIFYTPVPEPTGLAVMALAGIAALRRRRAA